MCSGTQRTTFRDANTSGSPPTQVCSARRQSPTSTIQAFSVACAAPCIVSLLAIFGCQRSAPVQFVSSKQVQELEAPLQEAVRGQLAKYCGTPTRVKKLGGATSESNNLELGQDVYHKNCEQCHGVSGDGNGPAAVYLSPRPRDYRRGIFKFTSTKYGSKPLREDLVRTVTRGVPGTSMPSFGRLPKRQLEAVVDYVLALTHRGELEQSLAVQAEVDGELSDEIARELADAVISRWRQAPGEVVEAATKMPPMTADSIATGAEVFQKRECFKCHGRNGRGGLAGGIEVAEDSWGHKTAAADLTSGMLHGGQSPIDVYRRIYAGINGTPMPGFKEAFSAAPDDVWHLTHYVLDLADQRRRGLKIPVATPGGTIVPAAAGPERRESTTTPPKEAQ
jgi:mono/diheme cytochrome c family protein